MIIKTKNLSTFIETYNDLIGTEFEYEYWDAQHTHVYAFDLETDKECSNFDKLKLQYEVNNY